MPTGREKLAKQNGVSFNVFMSGLDGALATVPLLGTIPSAWDDVMEYRGYDQLKRYAIKPDDLQHE